MKITINIPEHTYNVDNNRLLIVECTHSFYNPVLTIKIDDRKIDVLAEDLKAAINACIV